ncbi:MAG: ice-binding family protein [Sideroxyarcus sp.]|nr:ice-binding family protein [Sideroxyarcus sp.]
MNRFNGFTGSLMWFMALLLTAFAAGCGNGGNDPILGGAGFGIILGAPPGAIIPGGVCTASSGPTIPTVDSSVPFNNNQSVAVGTGVKLITATFSLAMDPATINSPTPGALSTFTLKDMTTASGTIVPGTVAMNGTNKVATFTTSSPLVANTSYTAVITTAATSSVATGSIPIACSYAWNFKTAAAVVPLAINLGTAAAYGIASMDAMTSTGVTVVNGNIALYPLGTCTDATGGPGSSLQSCMVEAYGAHSTGLTVNGSVRFPTDSDTGATASAVMSDLTAAWTEGFNKIDTFATGSLSGQLAGKTLLPGVYNEANLGLSAGGVATFDAQNNANAIFIVKVGTVGGTGDFTDSGTLLLPSSIVLSNQAQARNIWFVVGRDITIGSGTAWNGNILAGRDATILDGSTVEGRVLGGAGGVAGAIVLTGAAAPSVTTITVP